MSKSKVMFESNADLFTPIGLLTVYSKANFLKSTIGAICLDFILYYSFWLGPIGSPVRSFVEKASRRRCLGLIRFA